MKKRYLPLSRAHGTELAASGPFRYLLANSKNVGQLGTGVCPAECSLKPRSPLISAVSIGGNCSVPKPFLPKQPVDLAGVNLSYKLSHRVGPAVARFAGLIHVGQPRSHKHRTRRAKRDQLIVIDGQVSRSQRSRILHQVAAHPVVELRLDMAQRFPINMPVKLGPALARRTAIENCKPWVIGHGHQRRLPHPRVAFNPHVTSVHAALSV